MFIKNLENLQAILRKGAAHATEVGMSETDFLAQSLAPDMFPLLKQIQIVTDNAKGAAARLTGIEPLKIEDTESTCDALQHRIDVVIEYLQHIDGTEFTTAADRHIFLPYMDGKYLLGSDYVTDFAVPNFFFHLNMVYAIIRSLGTPIGKMDYLGRLSLHDAV
jgi:hypothetical protein